VKFFFPDSQDQIDPLFDFASEEHPAFRVRQRDDRYAHEVLSTVPFDGILVSKAIVDGSTSGTGKYTGPQRARFFREGVRRFFRLDQTGDRSLETMGDCGAFAYVKEERPPYRVDEVIDFYEQAGFDFGISMDHIVLGFTLDPSLQLPGMTQRLTEWERRRLLTLDLAAEFYGRYSERRCSFSPIGAAQGWSPESYASSVDALQRIGYERVALGGMVALKTREILLSLVAIQAVLAPSTQLHLLGVTRVDHLDVFAGLSVASFDSTSPFRQAFKDATDNYYLLEGALTAVRVPQVEGNSKLKARIQAGKVSQEEAIALERGCLIALRQYAECKVDIDVVVDSLQRYEMLWDGKKDRAAQYRKTLETRPWEHCGCGVCEEVGIEVVTFRGSERNKRRGFHNLHVFRKRLEQEVASSTRHDKKVLAHIGSGVETE
jgi:hypothetical protein